LQSCQHALEVIFIICLEDAFAYVNLKLSDHHSLQNLACLDDSHLSGSSPQRPFELLATYPCV